MAVDAAGLLVGLNRATLLRLGVRPLCEAIGVQSHMRGGHAGDWRVRG